MSSNNRTGKGLGCFTFVGWFLASISSYSLNHSLLWALFHGFCGWLYILYLLMGFGGGIPSLNL